MQFINQNNCQHQARSNYANISNPEWVFVNRSKNIQLVKDFYLTRTTYDMIKTGKPVVDYVNNRKYFAS